MAKKQVNKKRKLGLFDFEERYKRDPKGFIFRAACSLVATVFGILILLPDFKALRQNAVFFLLTRVFISCVVLYFAWLSNHRPEVLSAKIAISAIAPLFWLSFFDLSGKIILLIWLIVCWALIVYTICLRIITGENYVSLTSITVGFSFIMTQTGLSDYTYLDLPGALHFWVLPLILSIACGVACIILMWSGLLVLKEDSKGNRIGWVVIFLFAFFFMFITTAYHLNYALDPEPPQTSTVIITQKEIRSAGKSTSHDLHFWYDGEERVLEVGRDEYYSYAIGDRFEIEICQGAFGKAFIKQK